MVRLNLRSMDFGLEAKTAGVTSSDGVSRAYLAGGKDSVGILVV